MKIDQIIVTGRLYKEMEAILAGCLPQQIRFLPEEEVTGEVLQWADAYAAFQPVPEFQFHNLKWVHCLGAGVDSFLRHREWKEDVLLTRTNASFGKKISEYCLSYILADLQHHTAFSRSRMESRWIRWEPIPLHTQKVVVFGTGAIGQEIARTLKGLGVCPVGVSLGGQEKPMFDRVVKIEEAGEMLGEADWVINTLPLTDRTEGIFSRGIFKELRNAGFINVGRGATVEESALVQALERGSLRLAVLDVFREEPLLKTSILWKTPNVQITPHIAAVTSPEEAARELVHTLEAIEKEQFPLVNQVDRLRGY